MGNASSILEISSRADGGFSGGAGAEKNWSPVDTFSPAERTVIRFDAAPASSGTVALSGDGRGVTSESEQPVAVLARLRRASGGSLAGSGALRAGWQFEVCVDHLAEGSAAAVSLSVGLIAADASVEFGPTESLWGYSASGQLRSPHELPEAAESFAQGDTIRVALDLGVATFYKNGIEVGQRGVPPGGSLFPCVVLASAGDSASVSLRVPHTSIRRSGPAWEDPPGCGSGDPLSVAFEHAKLRQLYAEEMSVGPMSSDEDVQPWLVEQHLWGPGLSPETLSGEAGRIVKAVHRRLAQHTDCHDPIRRVAEARAQMVTLLRDEVLLDAQTAALARNRSGSSLAKAKESGSEKTAKVVSSGSFKIFLLITTSVMKIDPGIAAAALNTMLETIESIESGVLAESHPDRPSHISEQDLDSVNAFLHSLVGAEDGTIGQMAARAMLLLADRRGQARHFFHAIRTLDSAYASGKADWAEALAIETLTDVLQATNAIDAKPPGADHPSPTIRPLELMDQSMMDHSLDGISPIPRAAAASGSSEELATAPATRTWCYLENTLSGLVLEIEGGNSQANAKLWMSKKDESPAQMWAYDQQDGKLYSKATHCVLSVAVDPRVERVCMAVPTAAAATTRPAVDNNGAPTLAKDEGRAAQRWRLSECDQLGWCFLESSLNGLALEVECGDLSAKEKDPTELLDALKAGRRSRAKVWMKAKNRTPAQYVHAQSPSTA